MYTLGVDMDELATRLHACILEDAPQASAVLDASGRVLTWSRGAVELLGRRREELAGKEIAVLFAEPKDWELLVETAKAAGLVRNRASRLVRPDGSRERIYVSVRALGDGPQGPAGYHAEFSPIAAELDDGPGRQTAQEALLRMERFSAIGRIAAAFAHEMRTPLHVIASTAELGLEDIGGESKLRENLDMILRNARHAGLSVQALLEFARVGKSRLREGSLNEAVLGVCRLLEKLCEGQGVALELSLGEPPALWMDETSLRAALHNLLVNAIEAMPRGGTLRVQSGRDPELGCAWLRVEDDGMGMSAEVLARAGSAFFTTKENGTGLGLFLTKRVLAEHGAELEIASSPGKGTRAAVRFSPS